MSCENALSINKYVTHSPSSFTEGVCYGADESRKVRFNKMKFLQTQETLEK